MLRLSKHTLVGLAAVDQPNYPRMNVTGGIVHLGIGGFHRAHQAVYTDDLLASGDLRWGITGVSLRSNAAYQALAPQDGLYTVLQRGKQEPGKQAARPRIIGSVLNVLAMPQAGHLAQLITLLANPDTQVVSLTITEKGYCCDHQGELDVAHPQVVHDLHSPLAPGSAPGVLALGLRERMRSGAGPLTILSCDNLAGNGRVTRNVVSAFLQHSGADACAGWLADNVSFPATMVDRIVPATSAAELHSFSAAADYDDRALITCEPFSQWVIEDQFAGQRPGWDVAGARFVSDVVPFEQAKLRLLNATHSALAYLGLLAGYDYVHQAMADPTLASFVRGLLEVEITPAVNCPPGLDLTAYKADILARFASNAVPYRTRQVAADGSQKLKQRIFPIIQERLLANAPVAQLCLVVAAWLRCFAGKTDNASAISVDDPAHQQLATLSAQHANTSDLVQAVARETTLFGALANSPEFISAVSAALTGIARQGSLASAKAATANPG